MIWDRRTNANRLSYHTNDSLQDILDNLYDDEIENLVAQGFVEFTVTVSPHDDEFQDDGYLVLIDGR